MKILVTGHRGYIGTVLTPLLELHGHEIVGLDTDYFARCTFTGKIPPVDTISKDIRDTVIDDLDGCEAVIHLAGLSNDPMGDYHPDITKQINEVASIRLARLAKQAGVRRFLFASSCSSYGAGGQDFLTENAAFNPVTPYAVSKVRVEQALTQLADQDFSPTYIRASTAYGVSPRLRFDLVINNLTAWAFTTGRVYLKSDGTPWRPMVHVQDISRAYLAALHAPREDVHNQAFNVGTTTENYQMRELAEIVRDVVPGCRIEYAPNAESDRRCYRVDCSKIARTLHDFKPQWTARRGVEELYETLRRVGLTFQEFEGPKFMRIGHLKELVGRGWLTEEFRWSEPAVASQHG